MLQIWLLYDFYFRFSLTYHFLFLMYACDLYKFAVGQHYNSIIYFKRLLYTL